jgi:single-strand DNA-binding protein
MSNDLNHCSFIGRLGRDPETRYLPNGDAVTNFSIAVGESWKNKETGEINESVEWVRVTAWRKLGEICGEYLKKGAQVYVSGKMKTREWEKDGVKRYTTEVVIDKMQMLGGKKDAEPAEQREPEQKPAKKPAAGVGKFDDMDDDIPF